MRNVSAAMRDPRRPVVRRFAAGNLAIGGVAVFGAVAMLYLFWGLRKIPIVALPLAALMVMGGLYLLARPFADACAACGRTLVVHVIRSSPDALASATSSVRSREIARAVGALARPGAGATFAELRYCRSCGSAALWKGGGDPVALGGELARALIAALVPAAVADDGDDEPGA
jgi:hypothetical protein